MALSMSLSERMEKMDPEGFATNFGVDLINSILQMKTRSFQDKESC